MGPDGELFRDDLLNEVWREYEFGPQDARVIYSISEPVELARYPTGTLHAVLDRQGVIHILPAPGVDGCVVRVKLNNQNEAVTL